MAIVQVSKITHRIGLQENLPQLAGAEFGWTVDERRLFIGNGTIDAGAPTIGNTELLTEHSDILQFLSGYTYKGKDGGYVVQTGPGPGNDISRPMQDKFDETASVADFGALGNGVTDDTAAINRALYEVFCRDVNPKVRRSLYFPAGVYNVTDLIKIPPYAKLYGEGVNSSVIKMVSDVVNYVAVTSDSLHQIDSAIGSNGADMPAYIEIASLTFENITNNSVFLVDQGNDITFQNVGFLGDRTPATNTAPNNNTSGLEIISTAANRSKSIRLDQCLFYGISNGIVINDDVRGVSATATRFDNLYNGVLLGEQTSSTAIGPSATIISSSIFDNIYNIGFAVRGNSARNISANNVYLDVGNNLQGADQPSTHIISFATANNVSIGDMFERSDDNSLVHDFERVHFGNNNNISVENGVVLRLGSKSQVAGQQFEMTVDTLVETITPIVFDNGHHRAVTVNYNIVRGDNVRVGKLNIMQVINGTIVNAFLDDQFTSTGDVGVTFFARNVGFLTYIYYTMASQTTAAPVGPLTVPGDAALIVPTLAQPVTAWLSYNLEYFRDPTLN